MQDDLIYDVGLHDGSDTAYYLYRGFRVVAIDADPSAIDNARKRFEHEVAAGNLILLHRLIGDEAGERPFFTCPDSPDWSSADPDWAERARRDGLTTQVMQVQCEPLDNIMRTYGVPHYLKIDIEGHGDNCIGALDPNDLPRYVSNEITSLDSLALLWAKGYRRFQLIDQATLAPLPFPPRGASLKSTLRRFKSMRSLVRGTLQRAERMLGRRIYTYRTTASAEGWKFPVRTSSGGFGTDLKGPWLTLEQAAAILLNEWRRIGYVANEQRVDLLWIDVHASTDSN